MLMYIEKFTGTKGYNPIFIDFSVVPEEVLGEGWQANERGVHVSITVTTEEEIPLKQFIFLRLVLQLNRRITK